MDSQQRHGNSKYKSVTVTAGLYSIPAGNRFIKVRVSELLPPLRLVGIIWDNFQDRYYLCHASGHLSCRSKLSAHLKDISKHYLLRHLEVLRHVNLFAICAA